jgi:[ribosomal protein S5]-alanine N-acetyltransferase
VTSIRFVPLSVAAMSALLNGDLAGGSALAGVQLSDYFISDRAKGLWRRRVNQIAEDPSAEPWVARAAISAETGYAVGYAGFHGPPDEVGMVEIGYTVVPESRRQGYAKAMLGSLIQFARDEPSVRVVRLTISPDNEASLATMAGFGFEHKGEQWDDEDGLELIYEIPA